MTREEQTQLIEKLVTELVGNRICEWENEPEYNIYVTSCGKTWKSIKGTVEDNLYEFCPYCGSRIVSTDTKSLEQD